MKSIVLTLLLVSSSFAAHKSAGNGSSWTFTRGAQSGVRGGNTLGIPVAVDKATTASWASLQEAGISSYEKDRRAILALQGEFKASFEFLETVLLDTQKNFDVPYQSWGTEIVKLVEDRGDFISLQHIMVMFMKDPSTGAVHGPMLVKHWRQDWQWEADTQLIFQGDNHWITKDLDPQVSKGKWKWTVAQVDDTPRYSVLGTWNHMQSVSTFSTEMLSRPLPRREFSVRSDYKLLLGMDTLVLTPNSWFHEQKNFKHKTKLGADHSAKESPILSREVGHNSYLRIKGFDFSAGNAYWAKTKKYWDDVRFVWDEIQANRTEFKLRKKVNGKKLFALHFANAKNEDILKLSTEDRRKLVRDLLNSFLIN